MISDTQKEFRCKHCDGKIVVPLNLPPTTGPCPRCGGVITSPGNDLPVVPPVATQIPAPPIHVPPPVAVPLQAIATPPTIIPAPPPPVAPAPPKEHAPDPVQAAPPPPPVLRAVIPMPQSVSTPEPDLASTDPPVPVQETAAPKVELPPQKESRKSKKEKKPLEETLDSKPVSSGLIPAMVVLFILFLAGLGVVFYVKETGGIAAPVTPKPAAVDHVAKDLAYIRTGWKKDAYDVLGNYLAATDSKGKLPFVLNAPELESKIHDFYGGGVIVDSDTPAEAFSVYELSEEDRKRGLFMMIYDQPPQFEMKEFFRPLASLEVQYGVDQADLLLSTLARVGNFAMEPLRVHAFFKRTPEGLKIDWEIFAQTKYRTFQNFTELPELGQKAVFRVFIVEDVPDKGRAVPGTGTYRMADPANTSDAARTNVRIDSEIGRALSIINWRGTDDNKPITRTATVELTWAGEEAAPELEISRFVCWEFVGLGGEETPATASVK